MAGMAPSGAPAGMPATGGVAPGAAAAPQAQAEQVITENLNVAQAAALEAAEAAQAAPQVSDETTKKIATGVNLLAEAQEEISQSQATPAAPEDGAPSGAEV